MTTETYLGITIDRSRDALFDELGLMRLKESYMKDEETSPQERFAFVSKSFATDDAHAQRLYDYASKHWLSYATPILSFGRTTNGMPISCFLNYIEDTAEGLVKNYEETSRLSMMGGGVGIGFGIRSAGSKSTGVMPHLKTYDSGSMAYRQGRTRRGSYATYLNISHPDITMYLEMRKPTGDPNVRCLNLHHAVNITDDFMEIIERCMIDPEANDDWHLRDPHTGEIRDTVSAKHLWQSLLEIRMQTGEPYIHYIDTSNRLMKDFQKKKGLKIQQSNLCSEIILPTDKDRTAVCCLSSLNLEYSDEWSNPNIIDQFIRDVAEMLDNVLQYFIDNADRKVARAIYSASQERSIGIGALGFHAYLQKKNVAFESAVAKAINIKIFKSINTALEKANLELGAERGEAPDAVGTGRRFSNSMAIAPNASSSLIMGNTSASIEPMPANAYRQDTLSGAYLNKNKYLDKIILKEAENQKNGWYDDVWSSIIANDGSVQHLNWLDDNTKSVYKTAMEIDQRWIIELAADRQQFIDQAQSLNVFFRPTSNIKYLHAVHFLAWKRGLKTLYYCRSEKIGKADKVSKRIEREVIKEIDMQSLVDGETCIMCEG
jgi:ribonucleoside-diphosphate reductase alpha chain